MGLTRRLEIRVDPPTLSLLEAEARRRGISVGALVREAIWRLLEEDTAARRAAVEDLARLAAPVADWETMEQEIEIAYLAQEIRAALAARLGVEPDRVWEALLERSLADRENVVHEVFQRMGLPARYEVPFRDHIAARLREAAEARRGGLH